MPPPLTLERAARDGQWIIRVFVRATAVAFTLAYHSEAGEFVIFQQKINI